METSRLTLYHTGFLELKNPDVHYGRVNADFGQGFYTTDDPEFAARWARRKAGSDTVINQYELDCTGLNVKTFERERGWFDYLYGNRHRMPDAYPEADIIIGPIANDTLYNTMGITTSGMLSAEESLPLLMIGPVYKQIVLKSERAAAQLHWMSSRIITDEEIRHYAAAVKAEEEAFMKEFTERLSAM